MTSDRRAWFVCSATLLAGGAILLLGCATAAQRQGQTIASGMKAAGAQMNACMAAVVSDPAIAPLMAHMPATADQVTLLQMTDISLATPEEVRLFSAFRAKGAVCRHTMIEQVASVAPSLVPIMIEQEAKADQNALSLARQEQSWGQFLTNAKIISGETRLKIMTETQQIATNLDAENEQELEQRQAALAAAAQYFQNQQLINSLNRPVSTQCQRIGAMVNCSAY